jgi:N-acetylglutamate synthase
MTELSDGAIEINPFSLDAYDAVLALWRQCEGIGLSQADSRENIQRYLERNPGMSFIATFNGTVVGAVLCGHDGRRGYIHHLAVHPSCRRTKTGPSNPAAVAAGAGTRPTV